MVPSAYLFLNDLPVSGARADQSCLQKLASDLSNEDYNELRSRLKDIFSKLTAAPEVTPNETVLRSAWSSILKVPIDHIDASDNFFRLGGDSVLAMKLAANLRSQGYGLSVADIFRHMRLCDAAMVMTTSERRPEANAPAYKAFSTLKCHNASSFLNEHVYPKLSSNDLVVKDVAPVTTSQALDLKATINAPRTSYQYTMLIMDRTVDTDRLLRSCNELVKAHDILRTVFIEHGAGFLQVVLEDLTVSISQKKTTDTDLSTYVKNICELRAESDFVLGSPFVEFTHVEGVDGHHALVIGLSHAQYDGVSLPSLLRDLEALYAGSDLQRSEAFPRYIARTLESTNKSKAVEYWSTLLKDASMSRLVGDATLPSDKAIFQHKPVAVDGKPKETTTAALLSAAWAVVLARRLQKRDVTFGSITSGRNIGDVFLEDVQGPCYQFTPVRVPFREGWTARDLLAFVQQQAASSAAHDFLGFDAIAKECTNWPVEDGKFFYDSIVHHQDWEDFDTMPFAGSEVKVDVFNPHGDAAHPLKIVSFVKGGETRVGVVGSERDPVFLDKLLDELALCVGELARGNDVSIIT